jgi:hypothetical protein
MTARSPSDRLVNHLQQAERHLSAAIKLLYAPEPPHRRVKYQKRLIAAQKAIMALSEEEVRRKANRPESK